jgi:cyclophilin family peptidyl-prolyl cis-trans isomerase
VLAQLVEKHPNDVRVVYRYFPLSSHPLSLKAAYATEAAGMQGKFWEMHDNIFKEQNTWAGLTADQFQTWLEDQAETLKLDKAKFIQDMNSNPVIDKILAAQKHGKDIQIPGTPFVLINGQYYSGPRDLESFESILGSFQLKDRQFTYCPPMQIDPKKEYTATLKTEKGDIIIQLFPDKAPMAVNSFVFLARQGWYNNVIFHLVIPDFIAQSGDPSGSGFGSPGYYFNDEISDLKYDKEGVVGMVSSGYGTGTNNSQFFITYTPQPTLDGKYTVFGQVIEGMDVAKKLTPRGPSQGGDRPPGDKILSVEIKEN